MVTKTTEIPNAVGQLVWCPVDPSLGIGIVKHVAGPALKIKFMRLSEERIYNIRSAEDAILRYRISVGDKVKDKSGHEYRVINTKTSSQDPLFIYELENGKKHPECELVPEVRDIGSKERLATLNLVHPEVVRAKMNGLNLTSIGRRPGHSAILGTRVHWLPHQIDVASRALSQEPVRMILADEVGLGKTVEAILVYAGLRQEERATRVLIITPDSLCIQWLGEIYRKAHELFVLLDQNRRDDVARDFPDLNPFEVFRRVVISLDYISQDDELSQALIQSEWDLVIIDEAHHLRWHPHRGANKAYQLVESLQKNTRHLLLLTATPMALDPEEYHALLRLLNPDRFDKLKYFQKTQSYIGLLRQTAQQLQQAFENQQLVSKKLMGDLNSLLRDDEFDIKLLDQLQKPSRSEAPDEKIVEQIIGVLQHRHAIADFVIRNRRGPVGGLPKRFPKVQALKPTTEQATLIDIGETVIGDLVKSLDDRKEQYVLLGRMLRALWATPYALVEIAKAISPMLVEALAPYIQKVIQAPLDKKGLPTGDARLRWLVKLIQQLPAQEKILVFVESATAVRALRGALEPIIGNHLAWFHRGLAPRDQDRQVAWFREPSGPQVMLSTESGGEGRNFQFCHHVVLYDLPWRPATIEQRIGRIDRVGQRQDITIWVPYFSAGYEAAILKVMQESIGVLEHTVGGIDPVLEYVSDQMAELILKQSPAEQWKQLFQHTSKTVQDARERILSEIDPILDYASFSAVRAQAFLEQVPSDMEQQIEAFVERYADQGKIDLRAHGNALYFLDGAPNAAQNTENQETGFVATFSRSYACDHEDVELLSFGHPLVEQALEWANTSVESSAAVALCRGFDKDGAIFIWHFELRLPDDIQHASAYVRQRYFTIALSESGERCPEFEVLIANVDRALERMDDRPLRQAAKRWRRLVDQNYNDAEKWSNSVLVEEQQGALRRVHDDFKQRLRNLDRQYNRQIFQITKNSKQIDHLRQQRQEDHARLKKEAKQITQAIQMTVPRLVAVIAVRLLRLKEASA